MRTETQHEILQRFFTLRDAHTTELGLIPIPVAERFGVILARIGSEEPIDVADELAGLGPELGEYGAVRR